MAHLEFSNEITALLVIDPYNEFLPRVRRLSTTGPPGSGPRKAVVVINSRIVKPEVACEKDSRLVTRSLSAVSETIRPGRFRAKLEAGGPESFRYSTKT